MKVCGGQMTTCGNWFPPPMWLSGVKLRLLDVEANAFTQGAILLASYLLLSVFEVLGTEPRALCVLGKPSTKLHPQPYHLATAACLPGPLRICLPLNLCLLYYLTALRL